jgi:hypothetical protein
LSSPTAWTAWIESNILLELDAAPFDKQDETLDTGAGSCANCPKRTGFNKLLFSDVRKDSCTDPLCADVGIDLGPEASPESIKPVAPPTAVAAAALADIVTASSSIVIQHLRRGVSCEPSKSISSSGPAKTCPQPNWAAVFPACPE